MACLLAQREQRRVSRCERDWRSVHCKAALGSDPRLTVELKPEQRFYGAQSEALATFISILGTSQSVIFSVGAMVTMCAAVASRVGEIGTLLALGFRRGARLIAFLSEAMLLSLVGGLIGLARLHRCSR